MLLAPVVTALATNVFMTQTSSITIYWRKCYAVLAYPNVWEKLDKVGWGWATGTSDFFAIFFNNLTMIEIKYCIRYLPTRLTLAGICIAFLTRFVSFSLFAATRLVGAVRTDG